MTRMWCLPPPILCRNHFLGEHKELHQLAGSLRKGKLGAIIGHAERGQVETRLLFLRHEELVQELSRRGYNHRSPLNPFPVPDLGRVDILSNLDDLIHRCIECAKRFTLYKKANPLWTPTKS